MTTAAAYGTLSPDDHSAQLRKAVIASTIGTTIEWYDFFLYGTVAALVFPRLFFPGYDDFTSLILSLGTFTVGSCSPVCSSGSLKLVRGDWIASL